MMEISIIKNFRKYINDNFDFMIQRYCNNNDKNLWNCICACMDWIELSVECINSMEYNDKNINIKTMQVHSYISSIDIICESVYQLHRVIIDSKSIPHKGDKSIFKNEWNMDDNDYFKHIRAVFGAHPVNLKGTRGSSEKYFATWPTDWIYSEYDFATRLYSNDKQKDDIIIGFKFKQLEEYLNTRYKYLNFLIESLENIIKDYNIYKSNSVIKVSDKPLEQLHILKEELSKRLENQYYKYIVDELIRIFNVEITEEKNIPVIDEYIKELPKLISEMIYNIQYMKFDCLENDYMIYLKSPEKISYEISKLYDYLNTDKYDSLYEMYVGIISKYLEDYIEINADMSKDEVLVVLNAGLFAYNKI